MSRASSSSRSLQKRTPNPDLLCHCPQTPTVPLLKAISQLDRASTSTLRSSNGGFLSPIKPQPAVLGVFLGLPRTDGRTLRGHGYARGGRRVRVRVRQRVRPRKPLHQPRRRADRQPPRRRGPPLAVRVRRRVRRPPRRRRIHLQGALRRRARRAPAGRLPRPKLRGSLPLQAPIAVRAQAVGAAAARHQLPLHRRQDAARRRSLHRRPPKGRGVHVRRGDHPAHGAGGAGRAGVARAVRDAARLPGLFPLGVLPPAAAPAPARRRQGPRRRHPHPRPARGEDGRVPALRGGRVGAARRRLRGRRSPPPRLPSRRGRLPLCK